MFEIGDRVRLNELGRKNSRNPERRGVVVAVSPIGSSFRVQWDGVKTQYVVHRTYLERDGVSAGCSKAGCLDIAY